MPSDSSGPTSEQARLLDEDPDLGADLAPEEFEQARRVSTVELQRQDPGPWTGLRLPRERVFGLLVLDGIAGARIEAGDRCGMELVGTGDLLQPWVTTSSEDPAHRAARWTVYSTMRLAVIDDRLMPLISRWPALLYELLQRQTRRHRRLLFQLATMSLNSVDDRLLYQFWYLGERWGRMTPEGITLRLPLSHRDLADVVGARRPSTTTALSQLRAAGLITALPKRGHWLLRGQAPAGLDRMRRDAEVDPVALADQ